jgi:hypothetical protein
MSIAKFVALIPVCALAFACGGEQVPEAEVPEGAAAAEEAKPADAPSDVPADDAAAPASDAPAGDAPADAPATPAP